MAHQTRFIPPPLAPVILTDVWTVVQPLVAGNNVIQHNLNGAFMSGVSSFCFSVINNATGLPMSLRLISSNNNGFTIFAPVAVASVKIVVDV